MGAGARPDKLDLGHAMPLHGDAQADEVLRHEGRCYARSIWRAYGGFMERGKDER